MVPAARSKPVSAAAHQGKMSPPKDGVGPSWPSRKVSLGSGLEKVPCTDWGLLSEIGIDFIPGLE